MNNMSRPVRCTTTVDIDDSLYDLKGVREVLGHLAHSPMEISADALLLVRDRLDLIRDTLAAQAALASEDRETERADWQAEREAHAAALAEARAQRAAPGSEADVKAAKAAWGMLRAVVIFAGRTCDDAEVALSEASV
jgi:multidrug efflux pump subunit AcrA (membrane-fusion protein)